MRSYRIITVWGIPIEINISLIVFLPVLAWLIGSGRQIELYAGLIDSLTASTLDVTVLQQGLTPWFVGAAAAIGLFVSVAVHELGHSWVARRYGVSIESITLWIFGGVASMAEIPREWNREFWIAIAGPITSVCLGIVCYALLQTIPDSVPTVLFVVGWLAIANVTLAVFNLIPAFPMDGGRVLRAILARSRPYAQATRIAARIGVIFALLFAVVGVLSFNVVLLLVALFVYGAAKAEAQVTALEELLAGLTVADVMTRDPPTVEATSTVADLIDRMIHERRAEFAVVDGSGSIAGIVSLDDLQGIRQHDRETTPVADVMSEPTVTVQNTADAFDTLLELGQQRSPDALVLDGETVVGIITQQDYTTVLRFQRQTGVADPQGVTVARR